jgi:hypothetical protein
MQSSFTLSMGMFSFRSGSKRKGISIYGLTGPASGKNEHTELDQLQIRIYINETSLGKTG